MARGRFSFSMAKYLDSEGLVELADAINGTFLRKNTFATSTAAGVIKLGTGLKQTSTNNITLNLSSEFFFNNSGQLQLSTATKEALGSSGGSATLPLGTGFAMSDDGKLVLSSDPTNLRAVATLLKPYL